MEETGWHIANLRRLGVFRRFTHMPEYGFWAEKNLHGLYCPPGAEDSRANRGRAFCRVDGAKGCPAPFGQ